MLVYFSVCETIEQQLPFFPSNSQPSTPSTLTPIEGVAITGNMQHGNNMPKGPMMYASDAIGGLPSSANQMVMALKFLIPFPWIPFIFIFLMDDTEAFVDAG